MPVGSIPSPSFNGIRVGPFDIGICGLRYLSWLARTGRAAAAR